MYRSLISLMPKAQPLLLDLYPNASVAYSLRKLRNAYSGSAIRVRRSVDNTEQDFGFDEINDTLTDWVGYNLWTYSEQIQQSAWGKTSVTPTPNIIVAPDGNTTGDALYEDAVINTHSVQRTLAVIAGEEYTLSFWIKPQGRDFISVRTATNLSTNNITQPIAWFNLTTGTVISDNGFFRVAPTITPAPNGWFLITYGVIANINATSVAMQLNLSTDGTTVSYLGNPLLGVGFWGVQISNTSNVKPYQKTEINAGGGGFVTIWYDQSTNGNNATQSTPANQAQIVLNGTVITDAITLKPTTTWTTDRYTLTTGINPNTRYLSIAVVNRTANTNSIVHIGVAGTFAGTNGQVPLVWFSTTGEVRSAMSASFIHGSSNTTGAFITTSEKNASNLKTAYLNGTALPLTETQAPAAGNVINSFGHAGGTTTTCQYQEYIYWNLEQSANRVAIETLINDYYAIF
jgi:hypothetical protein